MAGYQIGKPIKLVAYRPSTNYINFVSDIAIFVLKRDVKLQLTN